MASPQRHLDQAVANREHAERLLALFPNDRAALQWAVTAAFYSALHCLSAHLEQRSVRVHSHAGRDAALAGPRNGVPATVYDAYLKLKRRSEGARYLLWQFTAQDVRATVMDTLLVEVTTFVGL